MRRARTVWIVLYEGFHSLDVTGPFEVLHGAHRAARAMRRGAGYELTLVAPQVGPVRSNSGLALVANRGLSMPRGTVDTLIVAGGEGSAAACHDPRLVRFVRQVGERSRRVASVCTGAFILAAAGLLDGKRATTHWAHCEEFARGFPRVEVDPDPIFVRDGKVLTSAGVTAGMDLALALVEDDLGRDTALLVARHLVMFAQRPGGQSQFSAQLQAQGVEHPPVQQAQQYVLENLHEPLSVAQLAQRAGMSPRNFARVFTREVGVTPAAYVERVRVDNARGLLERTSWDLTDVAERCGFGSIDTLRRAFARQLHVSPSDYRKRFRAA